MDTQNKYTNIDMISRRIDLQTDRLSSELDSLCTLLMIVAASIFVGFMSVAAVLYAALNH